MSSSFASSLRTARVGRALSLALSMVALAYGCAVDPDNLKPAPTSVGNEGGESSGHGGSGTGGRSHPNRGGSGGSDQAGGEESYPVCGDGHRDTGEDCDDGNLDAGDGCSPSCHDEPALPACGDGYEQGQEECDDSNLDAGDGCDPQCRKESCGNLRVDLGEECDPPASGKCTPNCSFVRVNCGNGRLDKDHDDPTRDEECDDGNDKAGDGCFDCRFECGDKRIDRSIGEECDHGLSPDLCSDTCHG